MVGIEFNTNISAPSSSPADMQSREAMEMMPRRGNQRSHELRGDTNYQPVNWKRVFLSPKYLGAPRMSKQSGTQLTSNQCAGSSPSSSSF
jgi:hypothetical protein